jgi:hypothetical protein
VVSDGEGGGGSRAVGFEGEFEASIGFEEGGFGLAGRDIRLKEDAFGEFEARQFACGSVGDGGDEEGSGGIESDTCGSAISECVEANFGGELLDDGGGLFEWELVLPAAQGGDGDGEEDSHQ